MNKTILITGAEGFIGSHLTEALIKKNFNVKALVFYNSLNSIGWLSFLDKKIIKNCEIIHGDIRDNSFILNITKRVDVAINLAALISIPYSYIAPGSFISTNLLGTYNILEAARRNNISKLILTSTSEVYGTAEFIPMTEKHPLKAQSPYAASKIAADQLAFSYYKSFNVPVTILRPFNTFGPRQSGRAIIPSIISQLVNGNKVIKIGNLSPKRDFTYVEDTIEAFILALKKNISGEAINIGNRFEISIQGILDILKKDFNYDFKIVVDKNRIRPKKSEVFRLLASDVKARKLLHWKPKYKGIIGFKKGLEKTIDWFSNPDNLRLYNSNIYNI
jgi:NAD dependent epimerase/dehydratase